MGGQVNNQKSITSVLVVDDNPNIRTIVEMCLEREFDVLLAESGTDALRIAAAQLPSLILLDIYMPEMDGPTTLSHLKSNPLTAEIPVVLISASVQTHEIANYKKLDVIGIIEKPFDPLHLAGHIHQLMGGQ